MLAVEDVAFLPLESALFRPAGDMDVDAEVRRCRLRAGLGDPYAAELGAESGRQDHFLSLSLSDDDLGVERFLPRAPAEDLQLPGLSLAASEGSGRGVSRRG